jgi:hypothetical protein
MGHTRVFIGYGYHDRDLWVEKYVVPFVTAFGCTPVDGREVFGAALSSEVTQQIHSCHAMIGFTTRRDPAGHVDLRGIREGDLVKILISAGGRVWRSAYESVDTVDIRLKG